MPVNEAARAATVGEAWAVVHSFAVGQFYLERHADAVEKSFRSYAVAAGEDGRIIGIFASLGEAHEAISALIRRPGAERAREGKPI